jgi:hypothetical protein
MDSVACTALPAAPGGRGRASNFESRKMENPTKEQIIHRAYQLWEQAGKPDGRDDEFYHQAEKELKQGPGHEPTVLPGQ